MAEFYNARMPGGRGRPRIERLPYPVDAAVAKLASAQLLVLAGSGGADRLLRLPRQAVAAEAARCRAADAGHAPHDDVPAALQALADELGVSGETTLPAVARPVAPVGPLTPESIAAAVALTLPEPPW
jgi:acetolactate synthase-1/2/3 large subunit